MSECPLFSETGIDPYGQNVSGFRVRSQGQQKQRFNLMPAGQGSPISIYSMMVSHVGADASSRIRVPT